MSALEASAEGGRDPRESQRECSSEIRRAVGKGLRFEQLHAASRGMPYSPIYHIARIYYPLLAAVDILVNLTAIVILSRGKCGLSKCITRYLVAMAAADLMVVIIVIIVQQMNNIYMFAPVLQITPVCALIIVFRYASMDCSVWFTVAFTFDRYVAICCQNLWRKYCTERVAAVVLMTVGVACSVRCIPFYFLLSPQLIIDNVPWYCVPIPEYYTLAICKAFELFDTIVTPILPICFILLFNGLTAKHIIAANRVRSGLRIKGENQQDSEMENRRKSMILLFALSINFVILWMPYVIHSMNWQLVNSTYRDKYFNTPIFISQQCGWMLQFFSTCTNTCIYGLTQRKFRDELKNGVKLLIQIDRLFCKYQKRCEVKHFEFAKDR
ncbi:probable G-protein coupled receptor 139 [Narcine bancroftii]|uniref:probable G-protein coupled receptor 139 n=1 Tax=Narcine bancroftii TaxID=1343680 RepID=UPI003831641B